MTKILVVEDDPDLRYELTAFLKAQKMTVDGVANLARARDFLAASDYDMLLLDWNLPDGIGIELLEELRSKGDSCPVLMLTERSAIHEKTTGFKTGADDYLTKPFHPDELVCRIQAIIRRPRQATSASITVKGITMDVAARTVRRGEQDIQLTSKEFALLEFLLTHRNQVFSTAALLERVWQTDNESTPATVNATILRLRKKIDPAGAESIVRNVFGAGYIVDG